MPPKKKPYSQLSRSAKHYRDNRKSREKKKKVDASINKRKEQVKKRVESNKARRQAKASGKNVEGKDAAHTKNGIRFKDSSANRGSKKDTAGDRRARGSSRRKKK